MFLSLESKIKRYVVYVIVILSVLRTVSNFCDDTIGLFLYIISTTGFMILALTVILFELVIKVISPSLYGIKEYLRRSIIASYKLNIFQIRYRIATGQGVYAESSKNRKCMLLLGTDNDKTVVKDMYTGKEYLCLRSKLIESLSELIDKEDYRFYDPDSYKELIERGYRLGHA